MKNCFWNQKKNNFRQPYSKKILAIDSQILKMIKNMWICGLIKKCRPISRVLSTLERGLIIYLGTQLLTCSIFLPFDNGREPLNADILEISPHRVYLVSLQHYLYLLSVALVLIQFLEPTGVTRYASLWCPDFPPRHKRGDKAVCSANLQQ